MGHYAAEMGYETPTERVQAEQKRLNVARKEFNENPIPDLKTGDEVTIAVKGYYLLTHSIEKIFLEYCDRLINFAKVTKGIEVLETKKKQNRMYIRLGRMLHQDLWYDAKLFTKVNK